MEVLIKLIQRDDIVKRNLSVNILYNLICRNYQNKGELRLAIVVTYSIENRSLLRTHGSIEITRI